MTFQKVDWSESQQCISILYCICIRFELNAKWCNLLKIIWTIFIAGNIEYVKMNGYRFAIQFFHMTFQIDEFCACVEFSIELWIFHYMEERTATNQTVLSAAPLGTVRRFICSVHLLKISTISLNGFHFTFLAHLPWTLNIWHLCQLIKSIKSFQ